MGGFGKLRVGQLSPLLVFIVVSLLGLAATLVVHRSETAANLSRFEIVADEAADKLNDRVNQHLALLAATTSFFRANRGAISRDAFARFIDGLDLEGRFRGLQGIGFARLLDPGGEAVAESEIFANYGLERAVWPQSEGDRRSAIVLLEPLDERNSAALGYDMYAEARRRSAMQRALERDEIAASAPVELVQEIDSEKQAGFLVYRTLELDGAQAGSRSARGFVYAVFRAGDLHRAALGKRNSPLMELQTRDAGADGGDGVLYTSPGYDAAGFDPSYRVTRFVEIAGRTWEMSIHETPAFHEVKHLVYTFVTAIAAVALALAMAAAVRWQNKAIETMEELHTVSEQRVQEKDLLLQEMKHRIKNSIARMLAMSRQTVAASNSLEDFSQSFSARLQSMANAQDMLTRSRWQRADLAELMGTEIRQVFGEAFDDSSLIGPPVELDERQTQALGLTFHELATNSLKYGAGSVPDGKLSVRWRIATGAAGKSLDLDWKEWTGFALAVPERRGFGTRLIDANVRGELGGTIERRFHDNGLDIAISIPLARQLRPTRKRNWRG